MSNDELMHRVLGKVDAFAAGLDDDERVVFTALLAGDTDDDVDGFQMPAPFSAARVVGDDRTNRLIAQIDGLLSYGHTTGVVGPAERAGGLI